MTVLEIDAAAYHADQVADVPTLSASVAHILCTGSPAHAYAAHPKLNPSYEPEQPDEKFDLGNTVHALLLQGDDVADVMPFPDWRTPAAREARDNARAHGRVPLLAKDHDRVRRMVDAVRAQLADRDPVPFTDGAPEVTLVWNLAGVTCRGRLDWLTTDCTRIYDLKTTSRSASPFRWGRTIFDVGADIQAAMYVGAVDRLFGVRPEYRWVVAETAPPFAVSVFRPSAELIEFANARVEHALGLWRSCLASGEWPGYPGGEHTVEVPGFVMAAWMEREAE